MNKKNIFSFSIKLNHLNKLRWFVCTLLLVTTLSACILNKQQHITGSPMLYAIDKAGFIRNRDQYLNNHHIVDTDVIRITFNTLYIKYIKPELELRGNQLLIYSEVFDSPQDSEPQRTVIYNEKHQPQGAFIGVADRVIYGPVKFKGFPIRVRLFVIELDKEDNETKKEILKTIGNIAKTAQPQFAPFIGAGLAIGDILAAFNEDDYELRVDLTFHPLGTDTGVTSKLLSVQQIGVGNDDFRAVKYPQAGNFTSVPMRTGSYLITKVESKDRPGTEELSTLTEYLPGSTFIYTPSEPDDPEGEYVLLYKSGYLWLDRIIKKSDSESYETDETRIYDEKTYVVLSVQHGGKEADAQRIKAISNEEFQQISGILQGNNHQAIVDSISVIGQNAAAAVTIHRIVNAVNERVEDDANFRNKPEFVQEMIRKLIGNDEASQKVRTENPVYAKQLNELLLNNINSTTRSFPLTGALHADQWESIEEIKQHVGDEGKITHISNGIFKWN